ncbi:MAG: hypothetical protein Q4A78_02570 [Peptostreptococcaceae bacterium]|nr:hypothetical protein [Peptostreptococcaceae bacterium]
MEKEKMIYELLNYVQTEEMQGERPLTEEEMCRIREKVFGKREEEKRREKRKLWKRWGAFAAAAALVIAAWQTPFGEKAYAAAETMLGRLKFSFYEMTGRTDDISRYSAQGVGGIAEIEGFRFKLDSLFVDTENNEITTVLLIEAEDPDDRRKMVNPEQSYILIDGEKWRPMAATGSSGLIDEEHGISSRFTTMRFSRDLPKGKSRIELVYEGLRIEEEDHAGRGRKLEGKISFAVEVDAEELAAHTYTKALDIEVGDEKNGIVRIESLKFNPVTQKLYLKRILPKLSEEAGQEEYEKKFFDGGGVYVQMETDFGKKLEFWERIAYMDEEEGAYVIHVEMEFEEPGSDLNAAELVKEVKTLKGQVYSYQSFSVTGESVLDRIEPIGEEFTIRLR